MAKNNGDLPKVDVKDFLASLPKLPSVYDAKDFTNRAFTLTKIDWKVFERSERNNYNTTEKLIMTGIRHSDNAPVIIETTQKGIVEVVAAIEGQGYFPCDLMIVQEGKYCTIVAV